MESGSIGSFNSFKRREDLEAMEDYNFSGYYGQVSYFLTGEKRKYKNT